MQKGCLKDSQAANVSFCLLSASVVTRFSALIVPPSPTAALLYSNAAHRALMAWTREQWVLFTVESQSTLLDSCFPQGTWDALPPQAGQVYVSNLGAFSQEAEYSKTMKVLQASMGFLSLVAVSFPLTCRCSGVGVRLSVCLSLVIYRAPALQLPSVLMG